jgi:ACS family glucarate transporter-like MFS transporter
MKPSRIRWWIVGMLTAFAFVSYLQRTNISVAAELMAPELHLSKVQMGQIFSSFLIGYAIFQVPCGLFADRYGTRLTLAASALLWGVCTLLTGFATSFAWLWCIRFLLGSAQATTYPVGAMAVRHWVPARQQGFANSLMFAGTSLAAAFSTSAVSWLMVRFGWRNAFFLTSIPALVISAAWWFFSTNRPREHRLVNEAELALTDANRETTHTSFPEFLRLLRNRKILLLCFSYVAEGYLLFIYVFWLYIYLVEVRHFSMVNGGLAASLPWLTGFCLTPFGGMVADRIALRHGRLVAAKYVIMVGYSLAGLLLFVAAYAPARALCVAALCLSVGFLMASEASFWVSATWLAGESGGAVSGVMNTAGILGGILSTSLVPVLVGRFNWLTALGSGTAVAIGCSLVWILIARGTEQIQTT